MMKAIFGSSDASKLDEGAFWPVVFALKELTAAEEAKIGTLVKKSVSLRLKSPLASGPVLIVSLDAAYPRSENVHHRVLDNKRVKNIGTASRKSPE